MAKKVADICREFPLTPLTLGGQKFDPSAYLAQDYADAADVSTELPAITEWLNEHLQLTEERLEELKLDLDKARAAAYFDLKTADSAGSFEANYPGKPTEEALGHAMNLDPNVVDFRDRLARVSAKRNRLRNTIENFKTKIELARTVESTRRSVFSSDRTS